MIKVKYITLALMVSAFWACEEVPPPVDLVGGADFNVDTTYVLEEAPVVQQKGILIEDLTGVRCVNCPQAAARAQSLKNTHPSRVVVAGLYTAQPQNLTFPHLIEEDLRTEEATNLYTNLYGSPPLPGGGVNRKIYAGQNQINQLSDLWANSVNTELPLFSVVNLDTLSVVVDGDSLRLTASATFNQAVKERVFVSLMWLENELPGPQTTPSGVDSSYIHEHVLRKMFTPYNGTPFYTNAEPRRYVQFSLVLPIPENVDLGHSSLALVLNLNEEENKEVLHVKEFKL